MQPQLDANRHIIEPLLSRLKELNSSIGSYEKSIQNEDFSYVVKLSNGKIVLSNEIVDDFGLNPAFVTEEQLKWAAQSFVPSTITTAMPKPVIQSTPPPTSPLPKEQPTEKATDSPVVNNRSYQQPEEKKKGFPFMPIIYAVALLIIIIVGINMYNKNEQENTARLENERKTAIMNGIRNNIRSYVTATRSNYNYSSFGGIWNLSISVTNSTEYMMDDVRVKVRYIKADGETWKDEYLDFSYIRPYSTMTINAPNSDRGTSISYEILYIKSNALGLR